MRTPATTQFLAAVDPFRKIIKVAKKNRYSLSSHSQYAPKARTALAAELDALETQAVTQAPVPFLPDDLIDNRFGVMQKVLWEANQCYERGCYNACAAMIRRLVENLIVECYERHGVADRIKKGGEYLEFGALICKASNEPIPKLTRK